MASKSNRGAHYNVIEQVRLRDYPFALAVQYHPERGKIYDELFDDFITRVRDAEKRRADITSSRVLP